MIKLQCMKYLFQLLITSFFVCFLIFPATINADFVTPQGTCGDNMVDTALGCISTSVETGSNSFFTSVIKIAVGLGGGLALILMLFGVFIITTSAGIPDKLKEGQEIITSAISGLIFIILSIFLLRLIGVDILGLPGLK